MRECTHVFLWLVNMNSVWMAGPVFSYRIFIMLDLDNSLRRMIIIKYGKSDQMLFLTATPGNLKDTLLLWYPWGECNLLELYPKILSHCRINNLRNMHEILE